jgi:hypothetical protein
VSQIFALTFKKILNSRCQQTIMPLIEILLEPNNSQIVSTSFKTQLKSNFSQFKTTSVPMVSMTLADYRGSSSGSITSNLVSTAALTSIARTWAHCAIDTSNSYSLPPKIAYQSLQMVVEPSFFSELVKKIVGCWKWLAAIILPFICLLNAYFGILRKKSKDRLDAASGVPSSVDIGCVFKALPSK